MLNTKDKQNFWMIWALELLEQFGNFFIRVAIICSQRIKKDATLYYSQMVSVTLSFHQKVFQYIFQLFKMWY